MSEILYSVTNHVCATCSKWSGKRTPKPPTWFGVENGLKGKCIGGVKNNLQTSPQDSCSTYASLKK